MLDTAPRLRPERLTRAINDLRLRGLLTIDDLIDVTARNPTHKAVTLLQPHLEFAQPEPTRSELEDRFPPAPAQARAAYAANQHPYLRLPCRCLLPRPAADR